MPNFQLTIFWWSVEGCCFCRGSKIVFCHWQSQSPLTQGWRYRAACDCAVCSNLINEHYYYYYYTRKRQAIAPSSINSQVNVGVMDRLRNDKNDWCARAVYIRADCHSARSIDHSLSAVCNEPRALTTATHCTCSAVEIVPPVHTHRSDETLWCDAGLHSLGAKTAAPVTCHAIFISDNSQREENTLTPLSLTCLQPECTVKGWTSCKYMCYTLLLPTTRVQIK